MKYWAPTDIAIIGIAGRFPGAKNIDQFWSNVENGVESLSFFNDEELLDSGISKETLNTSNYVKAKAFLKGASLFDADFFGFTARDAELLDPQFRIFFETVWEALENASYDPEQTDKKIGVFAGSSTFNSYYISNILPCTNDFSGSEKLSALSFNAKDFLTSLLAYKLNLTGPALAVQTACSTSLVAVCMACEYLLSEKCDIAIAGGVSITTPLKSGYFFEEGMIFSKDGHCRAFDAAATGTVGGDGVGVLVLKRLDKALAEGDFVHAVIKGFAVNNDGNKKIGFTAPSIDGQKEVIQSALKMANVKPDMISYIETHGTGTKLGDPIEATALSEIFQGLSCEPIALGTLKPNIGHLDVASGVAGIIKTILALKNKTLPPCINFKSLNPEINFSNTPLYINTEKKPWEHKEARIAGVSSFGIGGTNAHLILQEFKQELFCQTEALAFPVVLVLSARTRSALIRRRRSLVSYLRKNPNVNLVDVAFTLQVGRKSMPSRFACICRSKEQAIERLNNLECQEILELEQGVLEKIDMQNFKRICAITQDWLAGHRVSWRELYSKGQTLHRVPLPSYTFEGREYWLQPAQHHSQSIMKPSFSSDLKVSPAALEVKIQEIFKFFLGSDCINNTADFYDFGGDSLLLLQVIAKIQKELGIAIPPEVLEKNSSVKKLVDYIEHEIYHKAD